MTIQAWHFIPSNGLMAKPCGARNRRVAIVEGKTYRVKPPLYLCSHGLHASIRVLDALQYAQSSLLCRVEVSGEIVHGPDKLCATNRKVLAIRDIAPILHAFACDAAEEALIIAKVERTPENASWAAIKAKRKWMRGEITDEELDAARDAAGDAAGDAARDAAWAAAWAAATWTAARTAAWTAAWTAAYYATRAAAWADARADATRAAAWADARADARDSAWAAMTVKLEAQVREFFGEAKS